MNHPMYVCAFLYISAEWELYIFFTLLVLPCKKFLIMWLLS